MKHMFVIQNMILKTPNMIEIPLWTYVLDILYVFIAIQYKKIFYIGGIAMILKPKYEKIRKELIRLNKKPNYNKELINAIEFNSLMIAQSLQLLEESSTKDSEE